LLGLLNPEWILAEHPKSCLQVSADRGELFRQQGVIERAAIVFDVFSRLTNWDAGLQVIPILYNIYAI